MSVDELIIIITKAFHGVDQPTELTLYVAQAHDGYDYDNDKKHRIMDYVGAWEDIPDKHIEDCKNALSYVNNVGMRYYLPAYMVWTLRNH